MAPLDTGSVAHLRVVEPLGRASGPTAETYSTLGAFLQAAREHKRLTLGEIADQTRIRNEHLKAIEADDWGALPSRPFALGYVRAFARAVGLDTQAAVERFHREHPGQAAPLQPPVGMAPPTDDRRPLAIAGAGALLAAVVLWNIAQHVLHQDEAPRPDLAPAVVAAQPVEPAGPIKLSAPAPAPAEQNIPAPYITPGLDEAHPVGLPGAAAANPSDDSAGRRKIIEGLLTAAEAPRAFETRAAVYGEPAGRSNALLVARSSASLVVRGPDGRIWFARQLSPGEAYRIPVGRGLTADVSDPTALDLYTGGQLRGALTTLQTPLDKLAGAFAGVSAPAPAQGAAPPTAALAASPH